MADGPVSLPLLTRDGMRRVVRGVSADAGTRGDWPAASSDTDAVMRVVGSMAGADRGGDGGARGNLRLLDEVGA
jgi:hypothetical protein